MNKSFVKTVLDSGGRITPLLIDSKDSGGLGLCNPSIYIDNGEPWCILRNVNYTLYHTEKGQIFNNRWGPLSYLNPENDLHLRTTNFLCKLGKDYSVEKYWRIDTSALDKEPLWEFVGLEDARLVRWDGKLYGIGVRRDTTTNGQGRMEFSRLEFDEKTDKVRETERHRIEHPMDPNWYCEKNWMPVLDQPFHFVKYTNPVEVVAADLATLKSRRSREVDESSAIPNLPFQRGSSQVVPWRNLRVCVVHEVDLKKNYLSQKDATYRHRFVVWDKDWNLVSLTDPFSFMGGEIEFCCGLAFHNGDMLISFGFQDNCAFVLQVPEAMVERALGVERPAKWRSTEHPTLEITTAIPPGGCSLHCAFCPQGVLAKSYSGEPTLSYDNFVKLLAKVPEEVQITFAGFCEPFLNPDCALMVRHAHNVGHKVSVFTTGVGISNADMGLLKNIPYTGIQGGFVLHLPDQEGYLKDRDIPLDILLKMRSLANFQSVTMGTLVDRLQAAFPDTIRQAMYSRAGNVKHPEAIVTAHKPPATCGCRERLYHNVLLPNGDVALCCMDYGLKHVLGNLYESAYEDIMPDDGKVFELCSSCENGRVA